MHVVGFVDKVRVNPDNFVDKKASFKTIEYNDESYAKEIDPYKRLISFANSYVGKGVEPLDLFRNSLAGKRIYFYADLTAYFEGISLDMAEKLDVKHAKKRPFNKQMVFRKRSI